MTNVLNLYEPIYRVDLFSSGSIFTAIYLLRQ